MTEVGTVYLARAVNGIEPFRRFLVSYDRFRGGMPNQLIIVFKGFRSERETREYEEAAARFQPLTLRLRDFGHDIRAYREAVRRFDFPFYCFFNSSSEILDADWLAKMFAHARRPDVGLVGATGSSESMYSNPLADWRSASQINLFRRVRLFCRIQACRQCFDPFPNPHVRTTAFMTRRALFLELWPRWVLSKRGAYLFENGKRGLTRRVQARNLKALVVGRDGVAYEPGDWWKSMTFRRGDQANLLVADNQTRQFAAADGGAKARLATAAWGPQAANEIPKPPVGVVIVNHNFKSVLRETLKSFRKVNYPGLKIVVSDNSSTDGSQEMVRREFPEVHLLAHEEEQGYARAASLGFAHLVDQTKYIFSTTNDVLVDAEMLDRLVDYAENHPEAGVLGTKIFFHDRPEVIWHAGGVVSAVHGHTRHIGWGRRDHPRYDTAAECDYVTGCGFLLRSQALKRAGYFREEFVFYSEDADLCFRIRQQGYKIVFVPQARMWHKVSTTLGCNRPLQLRYSTRNELHLLHCHRVGLYPFTLLVHILGPCLAKMILWALLLRWSHCRSVYRGIRDWQERRYGWIHG